MSSLKALYNVCAKSHSKINLANAPSIEVAKRGSDSCSNLATIDNTVRGTSIPISGNFDLELIEKGRVT